jgi:hypothetical protein
MPHVRETIHTGGGMMVKGLRLFAPAAIKKK